jgi:peptidoglycan/LPS O-acetylase OafA/YrhL
MAAATALDHPIARLWLPGFVGWFAAGMALAVWHTARSEGLLRPTWVDDAVAAPGAVWACAAGLFVVSSTPLAGPLDFTEPTPGQAAVKNLLYAAVGLLVVLPAVAPRDDHSPAVRALGGRAGRFLGGISYGIFGYHVVILSLVDDVMGLQPFTGRFAVRFWATLAASVVVATVSFYLVERPIMRAGRRREATEPTPTLRARLGAEAPTTEPAPSNSPVTTRS